MTIKLQAYLLDYRGEMAVGEPIRTSSARQIRLALKTLASNFWGEEGKHFRIVQDSTTVLGFHARASNGDCIEFR